jgi:hypothetical protein
VERRAMTQRSGGFWTVAVAIPCTAQQPIVYKYVCGEREELGRAHALFIDDPIGNSVISVFDEWMDVVHPFGFVSRAIQPAETSPVARVNQARVLHEFVPEGRVEGVLVRLPNWMEEDVFAHEGAWMCEQQLKAEAGEWSFEIGVQELGEVRWPEELRFSVSMDCPMPSTILSRVIRGSTIIRGCGVYAPLVSLCAHEGVPVGSFAVLPVFARWAKACGMQYIHVHLEFIPGMLLDPAQVEIEYETCEGLPAVRDAKIRALRRRFEQSEVGQVWDLPWAPAMGGFARWAHGFLFQQLSQAYQRILEDGMQLFIDLIVEQDETPQRLEQKLIGLSQYASGIRIVWADLPALVPLRFDSVCSVFDDRRELLSVLQERFGHRDGDYFVLVRSIRNEYWVQSQLSDIDPRMRQDMTTRMARLIAASLEPFTAVFRRIASVVPATLILDQVSTRWFGPEVVWRDFRILPSVREPIPNIPSVITPGWLSPEIVSEFELGKPGSEILDHVRRRVACDAPAITFYVYDFLTSVLDLPRQEPAPIQRVRGQCRFRFPMYMDDLIQDSVLQERVHRFIQEIGRNE